MGDMTTEEQVRRAKSPQEAMLAIARALDRIEELTARRQQSTEDWFAQAWDAGDDEILREAAGPQLVARHTKVITEDKEGGFAEVRIPAPSEAKRLRRGLFEAQVLKLDEYLGDPPEDTTWNEVYSKGGPMWLYLGNRELVMSYPESVRAQMVADVEEDSPIDAQEMGRDVLKEACESGPNLGSPANRLGDGFVG